MSIFRYELAKIFRRRAVQITLVALFCVNLFHLVSTRELLYKTEEDLAYFEAQQAVIHEMEGPLTAERVDQLVAHYEGLKDGSIEPQTPWEEELYEEQLAVLNGIYDYQLRAQKLQSSIADRLLELENSGHTYEIRRLKLMQRVYSDRAITSYYDLTAFEDSMYYGGYDFSTLLAALLLLIGITPLFSAEYECGMDVLLKSSRRGKGHTVRCKLLASLVFTAFGGLLLFATDLVYFQLLYPFNLWQAPLFSAPSFYNTPLNVTVGGYILLNWAAKIFGLWVVALVIALLSALCRRTYFAFLFGAGYLLTMMLTGERLLMINPLSLVTFSGYVKDFSTVDIGGSPVLTIVALPVAMLLFAGVLIVLIHLAQLHRVSLPRLRLPAWRRLHRERHVRSGGGEWRKQLIKQHVLVVLMLAIGLKLLLCSAENTIQHFSLPSQRAEYAAILKTHGGQLDDKSTAFFEEEMARRKADDETKSQWMTDLMLGAISSEEYASLRENYETQARVSADVWDVLQKQYTYAAQDPTRRWLADTRGWNALVKDEAPDILAVLLIVFLSGISFSHEWECGMANTLRTTRYGRRRLAFGKVAVSTLCTVGIALLFEGIVFAFAAGRYDLLTYWSYPLQTLEAFAAYGGAITLGQAYLLSRLIRLLGLLFVQAIAMAVSSGTKRSLTAVFTATAVTLVSYFLLKEDETLYILPTPAGVLMGSGFFTLPTFSVTQWVLLSVVLAATVGLTALAVARFVVQKRGGRG